MMQQVGLIDIARVNREEPCDLANGGFENEEEGGLQRMIRFLSDGTAAKAPHWLSVLALSWVALPAMTEAAHADLRLCNRTPVQVGIAIGYKGGADWVSEGWWNIPAETCQVVVEGPLPSRYYYLYALDYEEGGAWGGTSFMCTDEREFTIQGVRDCVARGYERRGFIEVDTRDKLSWTIQLTEQPKTGIGGQ